MALRAMLAQNGHDLVRKIHLGSLPGLDRKQQQQYG